ncbi:MAG: sulfotransferase domain-containing protein, partial [SAR324 cluster bacterium]|nr:sulfotransferase domain-containing protein [SAR324 cluster bacterium]
NEKIEKGESNHSIRKLHILPLEFQEKITDTRYIIYIKRNPKAVCVSSFFYFRFPGDNQLVGKKIPSFNPIEILKWMKRRFIFSKYVKEFVSTGVAPFGTMDEHISQWKEFAKNSDISFYEVEYEKLLDNTEEELTKILVHLGLPYEKSELTAAVEQEDFANRKKEIAQTNEENLTFGKAFNTRFLRSGTHDDWKNYLTDKQAAFLDAHFTIDIDIED